MDLISPSMIDSLNLEKRKLFEGLLPLIIKKLILAGTDDLSYLRIPSGDDVWAPGFDGVISCVKGNKYFAEGTSVWEFGTNQKSLQKINFDYTKRTENSLGVVKEDTAFYLVVPKIWAYSDSIIEWESKHTDWKSVRVYDASILCDWINSEPSVCSWLLDEIFEKTLSFYSISKAWNLFTNKTNPPFTSFMFLDDRDNLVKHFESLLENKSVKVKADSFIDAIGFVLGVLFNSKELQEKIIVVNDKETYKCISAIVKNKIIVLNYFCNHDLIPADNCVILCFNKEATSIKADVQLDNYTQTHFYHAFKDMGIEGGKCAELYSFSHGNLRSLIRRIPGSVIEQLPDWAQRINKELLEPILYLRTINMNVDAQIVEKISGVSINEIERYYYSLSQKEDSPVKKVENNYVLVNYEEAWDVFNYDSECLSFVRFHDSVIWYVNSIRDKSVFAETGRNTYEIKRHIRNLFLNYVYFSFSSATNERIDKSVSDILSMVFDSDVSNFIIDNLSILAEASPTSVMAFISSDIAKSKSSIIDLFKEDSYLNNYVGVLSALDELVLHRKTAINACKMLFSLYQLDVEYKIQNSPKESLLTALCLFNADVALSMKQKMDLIIYFGKQNERSAAIISCSLIGKDSYWKSVRYGEHRNDAGNELFIKDILAAREFLAGVVFEYCTANGDVEVLKALLEQYQALKPTFLLNAISTNSFESYRGKRLVLIVFYLREKIYSIKRYSKESKEEYIIVFTKLIEVLSKLSEEETDDWMFVSTYDCPAEELLQYKEDYYEIKKQERALRKDKLFEILTKNGLEGIKHKIGVMDDFSYWGELLSEVIPADVMLETVLEVIDLEKCMVLSGLIDSTSDDLAVKILEMIPSDLRARTLSAVSRKGFWKFLHTEEDKEAFWKNQFLYTYDEVEFQFLMKYNPLGVLDFLYKQKEDEIDLNHFKKLVEALIARKVKLKNHEEYLLSEVITKIENKGYSDEWAFLVVLLYENEVIKELPDSGRMFYLQNPYKLIEYINRDSSNYYSVSFGYVLPHNVESNYEKLVFFINTLDFSGFKHLAGNILGRIPWQDEYQLSPVVLDILEYKDDYELDESVIIGYTNALGARTVADGKKERAVSKKLEEVAETLDINYPHAASVLRGLSRFFLEEGKYDYIHSETSDL